MTEPGERFRRAIERFDEENARDPHRESHRGEEYPKELLYARRMSEWLERMTSADPPSEELRLAVRAQHLCRWKIPRRDYSMDRRGYLAWRNACKEMHASLAGAILREVGYEEETVARVGDLIRKKRFKVDPEAQLLEDVACLVFLENHLAPFAEQHEEEKIVEILRKTWKKMSPTGHRAALEMEMEPAMRALVEKALAS